MENSSASNSAQKKLKQRSILSMFGVTTSPKNPNQNKEEDPVPKKLESAKKKDKPESSSPGGKQPRLPFQNISTTSSATASGKKRKLSDDSEERSSKVVRTSESKENIADVDSKNETVEELESEILEISDSDTETKNESTLVIKLPACSKNKNGKRICDSISKPKDDNEEEDSVVYLDEEDIRNSCKKKKKKHGGDKKKKPTKGKKNLVKDLDVPIKEIENGEPSDQPEEKTENSKEKPTEPDTALNCSEDPIKISSDSEKDETENMQTEEVIISKNETTPRRSSRKSVTFSASKKSSEKSASESKKKSEEIKTPAKASVEVPKPSESIETSTLTDGNKSENDEQELIELLSDHEDNQDKLNTSSSKTPKAKSQNSDNSKKLTPKQLKRKQEFDRIREEKERQKQKEREEKEEQRRKEREEKEEQKRKEREEKEEQRRKEKEERDRKRQQELDEKRKRDELKEQERRKKEEQKEQERLKKEEERLKKEEERKKKEQEREDAIKKKELEKQEQEEKKKKAAQAFTKFFVVQKKSADQKESDDENSIDSFATTDSVNKLAFMPFRIKGNMRLAPTVRVQISQERLDQLDNILGSQEPIKKKLYLDQLKSNKYQPSKSEKTWPLEDEDCSIIDVDELALVGTGIEQESQKMKHRAKLLLFSENQRPPYWGTWRKTSKSIGPRKPFGQDPKFFDYEVDSDDEWEEEEPGESLHGSDDEKDKDSEGEDYEVDNEFFVPHGHLSDEELRQQDEDDDDNSPEAQKAKLKILQQEFAAEMKKKTERIKPRSVGCIWMTGEEDANGGFETLEDNEKKYHCSDIIWRILKAREMMCIEEEINLAEPIVEEPEEEPPAVATPVQRAPVRIKIPNESLKELIQLLHGNINNKKFLVKEFQAYRLKKYGQDENFVEYLSISIVEKIAEIGVYQSCREIGPMLGKKCWFVKPEFIKQYFETDEEPKLPNEWVYTLEKQKKVKEDKDKEDVEKSTEEGSSDQTKLKDDKKSKEESVKAKEETSKHSITKYTVGLTEDEKRKQISGKSNKETSEKSNKKPSTPQSNNQPAKKRVQLLMSVPRGQAIPEAKKNNLISQYLKTKHDEEKPKKVEEPMDVDSDVILIE